MFKVTRSEVVNCQDPTIPTLERWELWHGLVRKAQDPVRFVPAISDCRVLQRTENGLIREVTLRGERVRERVTFHPMERVHFERLSGSALGSIENRIEEDDSGQLRLRFTFQLEVRSLPPGSDQELAFARVMEESYLSAIRATLQETRLLARSA